MIEINKFTLDNGLRVVHHYDDTTPMVIVNTMYDVGSKDEDPEKTGFAHLFEHLMFGGSQNIPDYDGPVQNAGGENNACTSRDITNYYVTLPKQNVEVAFWLESDRMLSLEFSQRSLDVQKTVVCEEFKERNLNKPYGDVSHLIGTLVYKKHPYMYPTIGRCIEHIETATLDDVKSFFFKHYAPNNAVLTVVGDISFEETERLVKKWYSDIPRRDVEIRNLPVEPKQTEPRFLEVFRDVPVSMVFKAFHCDGKRDSGYFVCDMLSDILSNGKSSRLYQRLVLEKKKFMSVDASISGNVETGLFYVSGKPAEGVSLEEADRLLVEELEDLKNNLVSEYELEKVKNRYESIKLFSETGLMNKAYSLAYLELVSKAEDYNEDIDNYRSVSAEQIMNKAKEIFVPENSSTLFYRRKEEQVN